MIDTRPRILCVDDEPQVLKFLEALFAKNGYEVIKAENGEEALEKLKEERVDLVISDVRMPKIDGFELCRRIKGDDRYRDIPVIIITGLTEKKDRIKGIEAGAEDFISKPLDQAEVLARVKMLLKKRDGNGRIAALEIMVATTAVRNLIREGKTHQLSSIIQTSQKVGMQNMDQMLKNLAMSGKVDFNEAKMYASNPELFGDRNEYILI